MNQPSEPNFASVPLDGLETVDGYACPTDPFDLLMCDSCQ